MRIITLFFFFIFVPAAASAASQSMIIGAWLENDNIIVKCEQRTGQALANAEVIIYETPSGKLAASGHSDSAGFFAFAVPDGIREGNGLLITVNGHDGHTGEWTMTAAELYAASSLTAGFDEALATVQTPPIPAPATANVVQQAQAGAASPPVPGPSISSDEIKTIVTDILEEKLEPIRRELNNREKAGDAAWWEIIGAAGWLAGLCGIFFYFMARKRS